MLSEISGAIEAPTMAANGNPAVLVIEEDPTLLRSLTAFLQAHRISVATACNGSKGLELFRRMSPAVVLTDLVDNGVGTIAQMRRERSEVWWWPHRAPGTPGNRKVCGCRCDPQKTFRRLGSRSDDLWDAGVSSARPQSFNWLTC